MMPRMEFRPARCKRAAHALVPRSPVLLPLVARALVLVSLVAGCARRSAPAPVSAARPAAGRLLPAFTLGLCEDYPEESRSLDAARRDLELARRCGATVLRVGIGWDAIEPQPGRFDWSFWDEWIRMAIEEFGIRPIPYVCYTPRWAASRPDDEDYWRSPPSDPQAFGRFMRVIAQRYRGRITSWELWNEPDNAEYWTGDVEAYAALLKAGSVAVKEVDASIQVVGGGIAWETDFLAELFVEHDAARFVDIVNLHAYFETWSPEPLEALPQFIRRAVRITHEHGQGEPIWLAEVGYSAFRRDGVTSPVYRNHYAHEHTSDYQADMLLRTVALARASGHVSLLAWYRINNLPAEQDIIGDVNNRYLGLLAADRTPLPALRAMSLAARRLDGPLVSLDERVRVRRPLRSDARICCFARPDGSAVVVAWLASVDPELVQPGNGAAQDQRLETLELELPAAYRTAQACSATGDSVDGVRLRGPHLWLAVPGGRTVVVELRR